MKKNNLLLSLLVASVLITSSCKKKDSSSTTTTTTGTTTGTTPLTPPTDAEKKAAVDISFALFTITDAEMIGSFIGENQLAPTFYMPTASSVGTVTPIQDTMADFIAFGFNQTSCVDGRYRNGTVIINRSVDQMKTYTPYANAGSRYYRSLGYCGRMDLSEYQVDGWQVTVTDGGYGNSGICVSVSNLTTSSWSPATTQLSWTIKGNFKLKKGSDSLLCKVELVKTLTNTSDVNVFASDKMHAINWSRGLVSYSGTMSGKTISGDDFTMTINPGQAIIRNFNCAPDGNQYHPFTDGLATYKLDLLPEKKIGYGGATAAEAGLCNLSGVVYYDGVYYAITFREQ